jgi:hypothetical protein
MYARIESVESTGRPRLDLRLAGGGLFAALFIGALGGYAAATLSAHAPSAVVSRAPAATVNTPSTGVYGDRDSRLPIATGAVTLPADVNARNVGRNPVPNSVMSELDRAKAASAAVTAPNNGLCDRNSCGILLPGYVSALDRANAARVAALQGMAGVDLSTTSGDVHGVRNSRFPGAPF